MNGDCHHEKQNVVEGGVVGVLLLVEASDVVEVWRNEVEHVEKERARHTANHHPRYAPAIASHVGGRQEQPQHSGCQHHASAIAKHCVVPFVRQSLKGEPNQRSNHCGSTKPKSAIYYICNHENRN